MKKSLFVLLAALAAVFFFVGCSQPDKEMEVTYDNLIGTWRSGDDDNDYIQLEFKAPSTGDDGSKVYTASLDEKWNNGESGQTPDFTVTLKDNVLTFTDSPYVYEYKASFSGSSLILTQLKGTFCMGQEHRETEITLTRK